MDDTQLILHVKGTEQTTALPKAVVRAGIAQGQISRSQLIWSPIQNAWKQVRELPHLLPSQKLAPSPAPRVTGAMPKITRPSGTMPKISAVQPAVRPAVKVAAVPHVARVGTPVARPIQAQLQYEVEEEQGTDFVKWVFIGLGVVIALLIGVNLLVVEMPLLKGMKETTFSHQTVYAHLGAFVQPNALVIHLPPSKEVTADNLIDYLGAVAKSTPEAPLSQGAFDRISLTSGVLGGYTLTGFAWKKFGDMTGESTSEKQDFLLDQLATSTGSPLIESNANLTGSQQEDQRAKVWQDFVKQFTR